MLPGEMAGAAEDSVEEIPESALCLPWGSRSALVGRWLMPALVPEGPVRREFWYKGFYLDTKVATRQ